MLPTLPTSAPFCHSGPVASRNDCICETNVPKRVGAPMMIASASSEMFGASGWNRGESLLRLDCVHLHQNFLRQRFRNLEQLHICACLPSPFGDRLRPVDKRGRTCCRK